MSLIAGIDIGTTSVKISLFDTKSQTIVSSNKVNYEFKITQNIESIPDYCQQNVATICRCLQNNLSEFDSELRRRIKMISICGQMHGCVLWDNSCYYEYKNIFNEFVINEKTSDLYNWMDRRCSEQFISGLPKPESYMDQMSTGFGCATIFWLNKYSNHFLSQYNSSGTVMDLIVAILCGLETPVMSVHNAMSWGYFDPIVNSWNHNILQSNGFPTHLLPTVKRCGSLAGTTKFNWLGIEANTPVLVALGDMQCATYASLKDKPNTAVLSVSTSMQMTVLMDKDFVPMKKSLSTAKAIDYFPYFEGRYLSVAASLNGGNVLQCFVKSVKNIIENTTDIELSDEQIWDKLFKSYQNYNQNHTNNELIIKPTVFGERHNPNLKASIVNISHAIELNEMVGALCKGLIDNIFDMMSFEYMKTVGVQRMVGTGGALIKNPILKKELERKISIPVMYMDGNDADVGAVWVAYDYYHN